MPNHRRLRLFLLLACTAWSACSAWSDLPTNPPPLADLVEPLELLAEPDDEAARLALPAGAFSGLYVEDARDTLAAKLDGEPQLRIARVVENSPAAAAGLWPDDLLLEVQRPGLAPVALQHPGDWRQIELQTPPGTELTLRVDRAGREATARLTLVPRTNPPPRTQTERLREDQRVGCTLRTATEVEARQAGLPPGGGAVLVGLAQSSPWRTAGLQFGDLIAAVAEQPVHHPQQVLDAVRTGADPLQLTVVRRGQRLAVAAPLSRRATATREVWLPLVFWYERQRGTTEWSLLLGILQYRSTAAAWRLRLLWLPGFGGGDTERLLEVDA